VDDLGLSNGKADPAANPHLRADRAWGPYTDSKLCHYPGGPPPASTLASPSSSSSSRLIYRKAAALKTDDSLRSLLRQSKLNPTLPQQPNSLRSSATTDWRIMLHPTTGGSGAGSARIDSRKDWSIVYKVSLNRLCSGSCTEYDLL